MAPAMQVIMASAAVLQRKAAAIQWSLQWLVPGPVPTLQDLILC